MQEKKLLTAEELQELGVRLKNSQPEVFNLVALAGLVYSRLHDAVKTAAPSLVALATPYLENLGKIDWANVKNQIDRLPARSKDAMKAAATRGWFFGWHDSLGDVFDLLKKLETANGAAIDATKIDQVFEDYFTQNFDLLKERLVATYPSRAEAIQAAAHAHLADDFKGAYLSVPVFLAQADGLLSEIVGITSVFQRLGREEFGNRADQWRVVDPIVESLLEPLLSFSDLDLLAGPRERARQELASGQKFTALNRHQVMHGESSDYGTRVNSLKAFSLLAFVGLHVPGAIETARKAPAAAPPPP